MAEPKAGFLRTFSGRKPTPGTIRQVKADCEASSSTSGRQRAAESEQERATLGRFQSTLEAEIVDLEALRQLSWKGIPSSARPICWMLLSGYLPCHRERRQRDLERKRREYQGCVEQYYHTESCIGEDGTFPNLPDPCTVADEELAMRRQIHIDVPRTNPEVGLFHNKHIQKILERILFVWSVRHPASGYVQGLNDLVTPFLTVFLSEHLDCAAPPAEVAEQLSQLSMEHLQDAEADSYWCFSKLLDSIQDHYTFAQPGIQRMVQKLKGLIARIDAPLHDHFAASGVDFIQFAFRWMNCLLLRELPLALAIRLWDTYLAEGEEFPTLHVYVCASLLTHWSGRLRGCEFAELMMTLQALPTQELALADLEMLISKAFMWREWYERSPNHLKT